MLLIGTLPAVAQGSADDEPRGADTAEADGDERPRWELRWDNRPSLRIGRHTRIDLRASVRGRAAASQADDEASFEVPRRRIGLHGRILRVFEFQLERELGDEDPADRWRDVYLDYRQFDGVRLRAGKFKLPFGLDELTGPVRQDFVHRSLAATELSAGRDRGVMLHGRLARRLLEYELGLFDHDGRNARTSNPERVYAGRTAAGRLIAHPLRRSNTPARDLQVGVAFTSGDVPEGITALRGRTVLGRLFVPTDLRVNGRRVRTGLEARWRPGPFSVQAEHVRMTTERRGQSVRNTDLSELVATAWYASGTWLVTGERKIAGAHVPARPLFAGGAGSVELALRLERIAFRSRARDSAPSLSPRADAVLGNANRAVTAGVNWHPRRGIKVQANVIHETLEQPALGPAPARAGFWSRVLQVQLTL